MCKYFLMGWPQKKVFMWFCRRWASFFSNQTTLGAIFARIFREFAQICRYFAKVFTDFAQIFTGFVRMFRDFARIFSKSKLLGVRFHPRLLHHWFHRNIRKAQLFSFFIFLRVLSYELTSVVVGEDMCITSALHISAVSLSYERTRRFFALYWCTETSLLISHLLRSS